MNAKKFLIGLVSLILGGCSAEIVSSEDVVDTAAAPLYKPTNDVYLDFEGKDRAAVSSGAERLDLFVVKDLNVDYYPYAHSTGWRTKVELKRPGVLKMLTSVTAVKNGSGNRIDVFAVAADKKIYHRFKTGPGDTDWSAWFPILNEPTVLENSAIAAASWASGRLDLFWWTPSGNLGHAWADNNQWSGIETGDTAAKTYLQPLSSSNSDLTAVSWGPNRIDLFYRSGLMQLGHHWYTGGWGRELFTLWDADAQGAITPTSVAVASKGANQLDVLVVGVFANLQFEAYRTSFSNAWPLVAGQGNTLRLERIERKNTSAPFSIETALRWNNGARLDIFGSKTFDGKTWQAYK